MYCDKTADGYVGYYRIDRINGSRKHSRMITHHDPLVVCRRVMYAARKALKRDTKPWMKEAIAAGWRP